MKYKILDKNSIIKYLLNISEIQDFFDDNNLEIQELSGGNLNFVYLVTSRKDPKKSLIVKQAVPYLKCVGEDFSLSRERMTFEIRALKEFKKLAPNFILDIYYENENMSLLVMQYLDIHNILRGDLIKGIIFPNFANDISTYLANILFATSSLCLQSKEKRQLIDKFNHNIELCKLTEDFVFTFAFMEHEANDNESIKNNPLAKNLFIDMHFKQKVLELKYKFMTQTDALLHGDLHTGSIMLNQTQTYVIDPEFSFIGPFGFDIGALIANLINNYIYHEIVTNNIKMKEYLLLTMKEILIQFQNKFILLWDKQLNSSLILDGFIDNQTLKNYQEIFMLNILKDSVGFAGCKMARRIFGTAGVDDIRGIQNKELRIKAEILVIKIAKQFVINYNSIDTVDDMIFIIKNSNGW
jgi:5-methylthioribose kinase